VGRSLTSVVSVARVSVIAAPTGASAHIERLCLDDIFNRPISDHRQGTLDKKSMGFLHWISIARSKKLTVC